MRDADGIVSVLVHNAVLPWSLMTRHEDTVVQLLVYIMSIQNDRDTT